jgi:hypothetical protein
MRSRALTLVRRLVVLALAAAALLSPAAARAAEDSSLAALLDHTNQLFFRGDYAGAAAGYLRLVELGASDADILFNLGTAQARADQLGPAVFALRRAAALEPGDDRIQQNLATVQALARARYTATDRVALKGADREGALAPLLDRLARPRTAYALLLLEWLLLAAFLLRRRLTGDRPVPLRILQATLAALALVCALGLWGVAARTGESHHQGRAIVLADRAPAREGPSPSARQSFEVVAGLPVRLVSEETGWVKLRLRNGLEGWVPADTVGRL